MKENGIPTPEEKPRQTDGLPRLADGTITLGPQGWDGKWNRPTGASRLDKTPVPTNADTSELNPVKLPDVTVEAIKGSQSVDGENVLYQAPNRLPGGDKRVQPW